MRLTKIINEINNPVSALMKKLKSSGYGSFDTFSLAYKHLVITRKCVMRSMLLSKQEKAQKIAKIEDQIEKRVKDKDGNLINPNLIPDIQSNHWYWMRRYNQFLRKLQELEADWYDLLASRGVNVLTADDVEEVEFLAPKESSSEKEDE